MSSTKAVASDNSTGNRVPIRQVYDANSSLPPIKPYLLETARHTTFAYEKARLDLKALHKDTWFGYLWNVLSPLLLGLVYLILIKVIFRSGSGNSWEVIAQIMGGLFFFALPSAALNIGARCIVGGGVFVLNTRLPRLILPIGATISSFLMFAPSLIVYAVMHLLAGYPVGFALLWLFPLVAVLVAISFGLATIFATLNVFYRDVSTSLPFITRMWMYLSPIVFVYTFFPHRLRWLVHLNPLGGVFTSLQQVLIEGNSPRYTYLLSSLGWSVALVTFGIWLFLRKEREFAVRI